MTDDEIRKLFDDSIEASEGVMTDTRDLEARLRDANIGFGLMKEAADALAERRAEIGRLHLAYREEAERHDQTRAQLAEAQRQAVPREPTEAMQKAMLAAMFDLDHSDMKRREGYLIVRKGWRAGHDAATERKP